MSEVILSVVGILFYQGSKDILSGRQQGRCEWLSEVILLTVEAVVASTGGCQCLAIKCMGTPLCFPANFTKGTNFSDFL